MVDKGGFDLQAMSQQVAQQPEQSLPPVDKWNPDFCGDIDMEIKSDGRWFYMGTPIGREKMVKLFARILWQEDGSYFLKTPVEKVGIRVEDAPFLVTSLEQGTDEEGKTVLTFHTSTDDVIVAGEQHPINVVTNEASGEPRPYITVRYGMKALICRNVFYELVELAEVQDAEGSEELIVHSQGLTFSLGCFAV